MVHRKSIKRDQSYELRVVKRAHSLVKYVFRREPSRPDLSTLASSLRNASHALQRHLARDETMCTDATNHQLRL